jgi:molybdenum cofactor biosynthesis enzyme MoaA
MKGVNENELIDFVQLTKDMEVEVRFIELMPFSGNSWSEEKFISSQDQKGIIERHFGLLTPLNDRISIGETAKCFKVPGFKGSVGFISTMTDLFCGTCNRLRLTADGNFKVCLHGNEEVSLRDVLRNPSHNRDQLISTIRAAIQRKPHSLGGNSSIRELVDATGSISARPMIKIGG